MTHQLSLDELIAAREKMRAESDRLYEKLDNFESTGATADANRVHDLIVALEARIDETERAIVAQGGPAEEPLPVSADAVFVPVEPVAAFPKELEMTESTQAFEDAIADDTAQFVGAVDTSFVPAFAAKAIQHDEVTGVIAVDGFKAAFPKGDQDILILRAPTSVGESSHRVHLNTFEDVRRAARGLALNFAGAIQPDGSVINGRGQSYVVKDGVCTRYSPTTFTNADGSKTTVMQPSACLGGGENVQRCKHAWAVEFKAGAFVTVSRKTFFKIVLVEFQKTIGTKEDVEAANAQIEQWRDSREQRVAPRRAVAQAIAGAKEAGQLGPDGLIPAQLSVLDEMVNGLAVRDIVKAANGHRVRATVELPIKKLDGSVRPSTMVTRWCNGSSELASAVAPIYKAAEGVGVAKVLAIAVQ